MNCREDLLVSHFIVVCSTLPAAQRLNDWYHSREQWTLGLFGWSSPRRRRLAGYGFSCCGHHLPNPFSVIITQQADVIHRHLLPLFSGDIIEHLNALWLHILKVLSTCRVLQNLHYYSFFLTQKMGWKNLNYPPLWNGQVRHSPANFTVGF